jgi:hypothetical protein
MTSEVIEETLEYPIRIDVPRPPKQSRLTNFPLFIGLFIRYLLLIPHFIVLYFLQLAALIVYFIATFAILFTGRYPRGMWDFAIGVQRWSTNVTGYTYSLYDKYPPFSTSQEDYSLTFEADYPGKFSRILNFPIFGQLIKLLFVVPHLVVLIFMYFVAFLVIFIASFAILFSGSFPEGMHRYVVGVLRWQTRVSCYLVALTDKYPPFSLS